MTFQIHQNKLTDVIKRKIYEGFASEAIKATGMDGLQEEPLSFEIFDASEFVGAIVVQLFWEQLHIKYLFIEEKYRGQGIATELLNYALDFGKKRGCHFAFVETMSFQAPYFYKKFGFSIDFSRTGYAKDTAYHYLMKPLNEGAARQFTRVGVYGVAIEKSKLLTIRQLKGTFAGKLDLPGGGIEFGESPENALAREFIEEVAMEFDSLQLIANLAAVTTVHIADPYTFYQIGMIYRVDGLRSIDGKPRELPVVWIDPLSLSEEQCSPLLWKALSSNTFI